MALEDTLKRLQTIQNMQNMLNTPMSQTTGGLLGNIPQGLILGAAIAGQGAQGKDPFSALVPSFLATAQLSKLVQPEDKTTVGTRLLTDAEKKQEGFDLTDVVQINEKGERKVLKSIPEGAKAKAATRKTVLSSIDKIVTDVDKLGTGFFEGRLKGLTTPFSPKQAKFRADTKQLELNVIKALRGAQVSAAEEDNVRQILPQVTDSETMYKAKAQSLKEYLQELDTRIEGGVVNPESESKVLQKDIKEENNFDMKIGDDGIYDVTGG